MSRLERRRLPESVMQAMAYDFTQLDDEDEEYDRGGLWESYQNMCFAQHPPIPALSLMRPILNGEETNGANFEHQEVGSHLPIVLRALNRVKINDLILTDNSLDASCIAPLIDFLNNSDTLSTLNLNDNPAIRSRGIVDLLAGIMDVRSLESLSISNTGCGPMIGPALSEFMNSCESLNKLDISNCGLKHAGADVAAALPSCAKLEILDMSQNELCIGGRRLAQLLGSSVARSASIRRLLLARNAIGDGMAPALLNDLRDASLLKFLDLSHNEIGDPSARAIGNLISAAPKLKVIDISFNPILNVTHNQKVGQAALDAEDGNKGGGNKKDKKPKAFVPAFYGVLNPAAKARKLTLKLIGLVVPPEEWQNRMEPFAARTDVQIVSSAPTAESFNFKRPKLKDNPPQPAASAKAKPKQNRVL
jgi:Ran GTPase-activating protein (RanGAP) involved in mRNA processing and transport